MAALRPRVADEYGEDPNLEAQREDPVLSRVIDYLESATLQTKDKLAKEVIMSKSLYVLIDTILYHIERDKTLGLIPPQNNRKKLFHDVHNGPYGGHL